MEKHHFKKMQLTNSHTECDFEGTQSNIHSNDLTCNICIFTPCLFVRNIQRQVVHLTIYMIREPIFLAFFKIQKHHNKKRKKKKTEAHFWQKTIIFIFGQTGSDLPCDVISCISWNAMNGKWSWDIYRAQPVNSHTECYFEGTQSTLPQNWFFTLIVLIKIGTSSSTSWLYIINFLLFCGLRFLSVWS